MSRITVLYPLKIWSYIHILYTLIIYISVEKNLEAQLCFYCLGIGGRLCGINSMKFDGNCPNCP